MPFEEAIKTPKDYIKKIIDTDIDRITDVKRDLNKDIKDKDSEDIDVKTNTEYLGDLSKLYLIENQLPFNSNIRSSMRIKQMKKRHFVDPSIATSILNMTVDMCINYLYSFGFFFETMVERDLRIYAEANDWNLFHYHDYDGNEFDDGDHAAFEIKLGANQIDEAAKKLVI